MGLLFAVAIKTAIAFAFLTSFLCLVAAAELAFPREEPLTLRERGRLLTFVAIYIPIATLTGSLVVMGKPNIEPLFPSVGIADALIAVAVADFLYYWMHRAQHAIPLLWRIHAVHHSAEKMGAPAGFHHWLEAPLRVVLVAVPASILFGGKAGFVVGNLVVLHGFYVHSTTSLGFGGFAWLLCDNRVHRIHHSRDPRHFDRNFGVLTLVWDRLFGTAYMPREEWPAVGLDGHPEPRSVRAYLRLHPSVEADDAPIHEVA